MSRPPVRDSEALLRAYERRIKLLERRLSGGGGGTGANARHISDNPTTGRAYFGTGFIGGDNSQQTYIGLSPIDTDASNENVMWVAEAGQIVMAVRRGGEPVVLQDTGWEDLSSCFASGFSDRFFGRIVNGVVELIGVAQGTIASGTQTLVASGIPTKYRPDSSGGPPGNRWGSMYVPGSQFGVAWIGGTGALQMLQRTGSSVTGGFQFSLMYLGAVQ